jgi:hypothetical protein
VVGPLTDRRVSQEIALQLFAYRYDREEKDVRRKLSPRAQPSDWAYTCEEAHGETTNQRL